ncbi:MAG: hypothetical protein KUG77_27900 [Nannocystaceae bacterium]|nr:hypothetical protein [Nannocystaceae bacterium]
MRLRYLCLVPLLLSLAACKALTVPPGLEASATKMPVERVDRKTMAFGAYNVTKVRRGMAVGGEGSIAGVKGKQDQRRFSFTLGRDGDSYVVTCKRKGSSVSVGDFAVDSKEAVECDVASGDMPWSITLAGEKKGEVRGHLQQGDRKIAIAPAHGGMFGPRGYYIREDQELAAVDVGRKSKTVWVRNELEPKFALALAATCTALMLYDNGQSN